MTLRLAVVARRTREIARFAALALAIVLVRTGLRARTLARRTLVRRIALRTVRFAAGRLVTRRVRDMARFAGFRLAAVRRTVLCIALLRTGRRVRDVRLFVVRLRDVLRLLNITYLPTWLKVRESWQLGVNTK